MRMLRDFGLWKSFVQEGGDVLWWATLADVPPDVLELLTFLMAHFPDATDAFRRLRADAAASAAAEGAEAAQAGAQGGAQGAGQGAGQGGDAMSREQLEAGLDEAGCLTF